MRATRGLSGFLSEIRPEFVEVVSDPRSVDFEAAREIKKWEGTKIVSMEDVRLRDGSAADLKVVGGVAASRKFLAEALRVEERLLWRKMAEAVRKRLDPKTVDWEWEIEVGGDEVDLRRIPILRHYVGEPGPYMTSSIVVARDEDGSHSASFHRMLLVGRRELVLRAVEGRRLHRMISRAGREGRPLEVSVAIGVRPEIMVAAATPKEDGDKLGIAGGLAGSPVEVTPCDTVDADAVVDADLVLEGRIFPDRLAEEGPFYEIMGKDIVRKQPVLEVSEIRYERGGCYHAILPAGREHSLLMGLPVEPLIWEAASKFAEVRGVAMTPAGGGWVEVAISIEKEDEGQPLSVALAAMYAHKSLKRVIIVDSDVNVADYGEVMSAVVQRADPASDYHVIRGLMGSTLDHSNVRVMRVDGRKALVELPRSKLVIDATVKGPRDLFERPIIPDGAGED